ncbi:hypothetical protein AgCh_014296 [Apium graveolens]
MTCICFQFPLFTVLQQLKQPRQMKKTSTYHDAIRFQHRRQNIVSPLRTNALTSSLVLGVESVAAYSGDLKVLLRTTTGLLFVYWIANFVVPELIMKDLQSDNTEEDQETKEQTKEDDSTD